jgi:hypothetical protein
MSEKPKKNGLYLVCAPSLDPKMPFRHMAFYRSDSGWSGLVPVWLQALSHWMPYPELPRFKSCRACEGKGVILT